MLFFIFGGYTFCLDTEIFGRESFKNFGDFVFEFVNSRFELEEKTGDYIDFLLTAFIVKKDSDKKKPDRDKW